MCRRMLTAWLCVISAVAGGCQQTPNKVSRPDPQIEQVRALADHFLNLVARYDYDGVTSMVLPSQVEGFDARAFVEDRFRMQLKEFQIVGWDAARIAATRLKDGKGLLTTAVPTVMVHAKGESAPVYVNLHWRKHLGRWYIDAFPQLRTGAPNAPLK